MRERDGLAATEHTHLQEGRVAQKSGQCRVADIVPSQRELPAMSGCRCHMISRAEQLLVSTMET